MFSRNDKDILGPLDLAGEAISITEGASASATVNDAVAAGTFQPKYIDVTATVNAWFKLVSTGTATAAANTSYFLVANSTYRFPCPANAKAAGLSVSGQGNGTLYVHPVKGGPTE